MTRTLSEVDLERFAVLVKDGNSDPELIDRRTVKTLDEASKLVEEDIEDNETDPDDVTYYVYELKAQITFTKKTYLSIETVELPQKEAK